MTPEEKKLHEMHERNFANYGFLTEIQAGALCLYEEARNQPYEGRVAQPTVLLNRARLQHCCKPVIVINGVSRPIPLIVDAVIWPVQFSWTLETDPEHADSLLLAKILATGRMGDQVLSDCYDLFSCLKTGKLPLDQDLVRANCVEYLNPEACPDAYQERLDHCMKVLKRIKDHVFLV